MFLNLLRQFRLGVMYLVSVIAIIDLCTIPFRESYQAIELFGVACIIIILLLRDYKYNS